VGASAAQYEFARAAHPDPKAGATCVDQALAACEALDVKTLLTYR